MQNLVFAAQTCTVATPDGRHVVLTRGEPWAADDPLVRSRPDLFTDRPEPRRTVPAPVEDMTAEPGSRRSVRRA